MSTSAPFLTGIGGDGSVVSSNTATQAFPTVPIEDDPTPPNIDNFSLIADLADFQRPLPATNSSTTDPTGTALDYGQDLDFDFDTGEPAGLAAGSLSYVSDHAQVLQWIQKAMLTPQGRYLIYAQDYGSILQQIRGEGGAPQTIYSEISRTAMNVMTAHPRVQEAFVDSISQSILFQPTAAVIAGRVFFDDTDIGAAVTLLAS